MAQEITSLEFNEYKFNNFSIDYFSMFSLSENIIKKALANNNIKLEKLSISRTVGSVSDVHYSSLDVNKIVKPVNSTNFNFNLYDCSEKIVTPAPTPITPSPSIKPIETIPKTYLFSGINPENFQIETWYDTNLNSKGPNGKIYIQVGLIELDSSAL